MEKQKIAKKIELLFIPSTHTNGGGAESLLTNYVNSFDLSKYNITINEIDHYSTKKELINDDIKVLKPIRSAKNYLFNISWGYFNFHLLHYKPEILRYVFHWHNFDYVIAWNYQLPSFALNGFSKTRKIAWFHGAIDDLNIENFSDKELIKKNEMQKATWSKVDRIVTISNMSKQSLDKVFPDFSEMCEIINNGIDVLQIQKNADEKLDFEFEKNCKYFCCVGRLDENKNFILAIKALGIILKQNINCKLLIIGTGEKEAEYKTYVKQHGLENAVIFLGYQNNPYKIMKHCHCLCMTSFSEGWGLVVAEMMALKKTFVTTKVAGACEELADSNSCGLVSGWDEKEYAECLLRLVKEDSLYNTLCINAYNNVQQYTVRKSVQKIENIFKKFPSKSKDKFILFDSVKAFLYYVFGNTFQFMIYSEQIKMCIGKFKKQRTLKAFVKIPVFLIYCLIRTICFPVFMVSSVLFYFWR